MLSSASAPILAPIGVVVPETNASTPTKPLSTPPSSKPPLPTPSTLSTKLRQNRQIPSSLPPEQARTPDGRSSRSPKILTPSQRRRHKLQASVLHKLERKKEKEGNPFAFSRSHFRGLGGNVSLFSKEYKKHLGLDGKTLQAKDLEEQAKNNR